MEDSSRPEVAEDQGTDLRLLKRIQREEGVVEAEVEVEEEEEVLRIQRRIQRRTHQQRTRPPTPHIPAKSNSLRQPLSKATGIRSKDLS